MPRTMATKYECKKERELMRTRYAERNFGMWNGGLNVCFEEAVGIRLERSCISREDLNLYKSKTIGAGMEQT